MVCGAAGGGVASGVVGVAGGVVADDGVAMHVVQVLL